MKFRKKPVIVEATQFFPNKKPWPKGVSYGRNGFEIQTLEGIYCVTPGDWIITGVKGEYYPCKSDIFELTYEKVEE